jgi:hypothetical protein
MAARGVWIEYDAIGSVERFPDEAFIDMIQKVLDAGHEKILLSHDRGWYDPGTPDRQPKPFTYLCETFLPKLRAAGFDDATIKLLTETNPFNVYARLACLERPEGAAIGQEDVDQPGAEIAEEGAAFKALEGQRRRLLVGAGKTERITHALHAKPHRAKSQQRHFQALWRGHA